MGAQRRLDERGGEKKAAPDEKGREKKKSLTAKDTENG